MKLELIRRHQVGNATIGGLFRDGGFECFTLEDLVREVEGESVESWKVDKETAIPRGEYKVVIDDSVRFGRPMPHVLDVPGFSGIRIHKGNSAGDTEGCILLGAAYNDGEAFIHKSAIAYDAFFPYLEAAIERGEEVKLVIR